MAKEKMIENGYGLKIRRDSLHLRSHLVLGLLLQDPAFIEDKEAVSTIASVARERIPHSIEESALLEELGYSAFRALNNLEP